jgi:hypothetical protein
VGGGFLSCRVVQAAVAADHRPAAENFQPFPFREMIRSDPPKKRIFYKKTENIY